MFHVKHCKTMRFLYVFLGEKREKTTIKYDKRA